MPRNASSTPFAMLTPHRHPIHADNAEILIVKLPEAKQLIDDCLLLASTIQLGHVSRIFDHTVDVEIQGETVRGPKDDIQEEVLRIRICRFQLAIQQHDGRWSILGKIVVSHRPPSQNAVAAKTPARNG